MPAPSWRELTPGQVREAFKLGVHRSPGGWRRQSESPRLAGDRSSSPYIIPPASIAAVGSHESRLPGAPFPSGAAGWGDAAEVEALFHG